MLPPAVFEDLLSEERARLSLSRRAIQAAPPTRLYHYTSAKGLLGILNSSRLWATNYRFLNDSSEVAYGVSLLEDAIRNRIAANQSNAVVLEFLKRYLRAVNLFDGFIDAYVACFCESDDLLSQWRTYGEGGGFAIGFDACQLVERWGERTREQQCILRRVVYGELDQRRLIDEVFDVAVSALARSAGATTVDEANPLIAATCGFVREETAEYLLCFKHSAFSVEHEWRLCHITAQGGDEHVQFRVGPFGLTPYVELDPSPVAGVNSNRLPIASVTHEPARYPDVIRFAVEKLLRSKGYFFADTLGSRIPVRSGI